MTIFSTGERHPFLSSLQLINHLPALLPVDVAAIEK